MPQSHRLFSLLIPVIAVAAIASPAWSAGKAAAVDGKRMENADQDAGHWMSHGRTWSEQRFSPLKQINDGNVKRLGLAWSADLNTYRGVTATPLVIDGVLYNVRRGASITAYDATNGKVLWTYDPKISPDFGRIACCGPVSQGLAAWKGKIILGALDGRLIALDAQRRQGSLEHEHARPGPAALHHRRAARRLERHRRHRQCAAAIWVRAATCPRTTPRPASRSGSSTSCRAIPERPADGVASDSIMPMAAKTWTGEWWKTGGGGNDWDTIVYDPELDYVYFATGNGSPHPQAFRSPQGGDNLFLALHRRGEGEDRRIRVALPGSAGRGVGLRQHLAADAGGPAARRRTRKVILHAPKNGFFYVLDAQDAASCCRRRTSCRTRGPRTSTEDRQPVRQSERAREGDAGPHHAERRAQLEPDVVQPAHGAGLHPGPGTVDGDLARAGRPVQVPARAHDDRRGCRTTSPSCAAR